MRDNLAAALSYAALGFRVFPLHAPNADGCDCNRAGCPSPAKHPRNRNGLTDATTDTAQIEAWWKMWPHANIGAAAGPESGIFVLDIDPRDGGDAELRELTIQHGLLPFGLAYETGSGGEHYWFRHPGRKVTSHKLAGQRGIDVKGDGGYLVVPPSVHATGAGYAFYDGINVTTAIPDAPAWLLSMLDETPALDTSTRQAGDVIIPAGERNSTLAREGGALRRRGHSQARIFKFLMDLNDEACNPPLAATEVAQIAASVARYEPTPEVPVIVDIGTRKNGHKPPPGPFTPDVFDGDELLGMEIEPPIMVVPDLLPEGLAILAGKPKLGKSYMSLGIGVELALGGMVLGQFPVDGGDVLILALEDTKGRLQQRVKQLKQGSHGSLARLRMVREWPRQDEGGLDALDVWLGQHPETRLVVIDTLAKFRPREVDTKYAGDYSAMEGLQVLAGRHSCCILVITHYRKALTEDWLDNVTGTMGISGAADTIIGLERPRGAAGQASAVLHVTGRDIEERDYALSWNSLTAQWVVLGDADEYAMGMETAKLIAALKENKAPMSVNALASALGKKRTAASNLCVRAASNGLIKSLGGGLYAADGEHAD